MRSIENEKYCIIILQRKRNSLDFVDYDKNPAASQEKRRDFMNIDMNIQPFGAGRQYAVRT